VRRRRGRRAGARPRGDHPAGRGVPLGGLRGGLVRSRAARLLDGALEHRLHALGGRDLVEVRVVVEALGSIDERVVGLGDAPEQRLHLALEGAEVLLEVAVGVHDRRELEVRSLDRLLVGLLADAEQRVMVHVLETVVEVEHALLLVGVEVDRLVELAGVVLQIATDRGELGKLRAVARGARRHGAHDRRGGIPELDDAEPHELLDRAIDLEVRQAGIPCEVLRRRLPVDAREQVAVGRVQLELAEVDVRDQPRELLRHPTAEHTREAADS